MKYLNNTSHNPHSQWLRSLLAAILASLALLGLMVQSAQAADTITYIHSDISGSPLAATDANGKVLWKESYTAFGQKLQRQPASQNHGQSFHGKEWDEETGQQYFGARYYDPAIGRFMGMDPVDYQQGNLHSFNRYAYGNNNPLRYVDPDGNNAVTAFGGLLHEGFSLVTGNGFDTAMVWGALKDGYDGEGAGFWMSAGEDALSFTPSAAVGVAFKVLGKGAQAVQAVRGGVGPVLKGETGVARSIAAAEARGEAVLGREITIQTAGGRTRPDLLVRDAQGNLKFIESKCGSSACLNKNQAARYPELQQSGGIPRGNNAAKAGLKPGQPIGPTPVQIDYWPH